MFSILAEHVAGAMVLDLFAGTGAIGIEALSRGAAFALFVDQSLDAGRLIETNLKTCFQAPQAAFVRCNLAASTLSSNLRTSTPAGTLFNLVFMDPPYQKNLAELLLPLVEKADILSPTALVIVEEHRKASLPQQVDSLHLIDQRRYGETGLWIYRRHIKPD